MFENVSRNGALFNQHSIIKLQIFSNKSCFEWVKYVWKMHTQLCTKDTHFTSIRRHIQWQNVKLLNYWPHVHQCIAIGIAIKLLHQVCTVHIHHEKEKAYAITTWDWFAILGKNDRNLYHYDWLMCFYQDDFEHSVKMSDEKSCWLNDVINEQKYARIPKRNNTAWLKWYQFTV